MKLKYLQLHNFRQFYGTSPKLEFAADKQNVTVVHGCNGSGKTALLNAFTWVLYESFSRGFQLPEQLANKRAVREARKDTDISVWVEIGFEHSADMDPVQYRLRREAVYRTTGGLENVEQIGRAEAVLEYAGTDGQWKQDERVNETVGRILPEDLHTYFFFDGERIERLVQPTREERRDIGQATKKLLGVEILERAERHLRAAKRTLEGELKSFGDADTRKHLEEKEKLEDELQKLEDKKEELLANIEGYIERKGALETKLRELKDASALQERRDELNAQRESLIEARKRGTHDLSLLISSEAFAVYLRPAMAKFRELIASLREKGELPAGIKRQFVADLLSSERCICGRSLAGADAPARAAVEAWMARAGLADVEEKAIRIGAEIESLESREERFWKTLDEIQERRERMRQEMSNIEEELEEIRSQLKGSPREEESALESQLESTEESIAAAREEKGRTEASISQHEELIAEIDALVTRHRTKEEKQALAQRRIQIASEAIACVLAVRDNIEREFRESLLDRIKKLCSRSRGSAQAIEETQHVF